MTFTKIVVAWQQTRLSTALQLANTYIGLGGDTKDPDDQLIRFILSNIRCKITKGVIELTLNRSPRSL